MNTEAPGLNYHRTKFLTSAAKLSQCPEDQGFEIAFAGRSNAGKSSALNALTGSTKLARTSKTPGRTQLINFFTVDEERRLVDLPGYGYAKVPQDMKQEWYRHLDQYLSHRECLKGLVLLMDIRHPLKDFDRMMLDWGKRSKLPVHVLLTKADKLKFGQSKQTLLKVKQEASKYSDQVTVQLFSALKKTGVEELALRLDQLLEADQ